MQLCGPVGIVDLTLQVPDWEAHAEYGQQQSILLALATAIAANRLAAIS